MNEHPILFSGPMVQAILEGRKSMSRRMLNPQPVFEPEDAIYRWRKCSFIWGLTHESMIVDLCPYGVPGDRLWVREAWRVGAWMEDGGLISVDYRADGFCRKEWISPGDEQYFEKLWLQSCEDAEKKFGIKSFYKWNPGESPCRWRPSIYMPRAVSRITLEVVNVRVERLQDISEEDSILEGIRIGMDSMPYFSVRDAYADLWDSINGKKPGCAWADNPWVWVVEFKVVKK